MDFLFPKFDEITHQLIKNANIISMDPTTGDIECGDILIKNDEIVIRWKTINLNDFKISKIKRTSIW